MQLGFSIAGDRVEPALRDLCRKKQISAALFLMPEEHRFHAAYSPEARIAIDGYLQRLAADFACPAFDAASWGQTGRHAPQIFADGHHLSAPGARAFSARFGAEVLASLKTLRADGGQLSTKARESTEVARGPGQTSQLR